MSTAYIVGAYIPAGGAYMAYCLGLILHRHFGRQVFAVDVTPIAPEHGFFSYEIEFDRVSVEEMLTNAGRTDILICNPSFSEYGFGIAFPGRKLLYLQGFNTYQLLDLGFDRFVCVSQFVADFVRHVYSISARVIPAFVDALPSTPKTWRLRPADEVLVHTKGQTPLHTRLQGAVMGRLQAAHPGIRFQPLITSRPLRHNELIDRLSEYRYLITLSPAEGFGLVPLEAMSCGLAVAGFDGFGGREYMLSGTNCLVTRYEDVDGVVDLADQMLRDETFAEALGREGIKTSTRYSRPAFEQRWIAEFADFLGEAPRA